MLPLGQQEGEVTCCQLQQGAAKGVVALWWMLQQVHGPFARHPQRLFGPLEQPLAIHRAPHVDINRRFVSERDVDHPIFELRSTDKQPEQASVIEYDPTRMRRQAEF